MNHINDSRKSDTQSNHGELIQQPVISTCSVISNDRGKQVDAFQNVWSQRMAAQFSLDEDGSEILSFPLYLSLQRYHFVADYLKHNLVNVEYHSLADFGSSSCRVGQFLMNDVKLNKIYFLDKCPVSLSDGFDNLNGAFMGRSRERKHPLVMQFLSGDASKYNPQFRAVDIILLIEVIEHLPQDESSRMVELIFSQYLPKCVIVSTPNSEFNSLFPGNDGKFRHWDHKFEFTREQFSSWCRSTVNRYPWYTYELHGVGCTPNQSDHTRYGFATQIAVFRKVSDALPLILNPLLVPEESRLLFTKVINPLLQNNIPFLDNCDGAEDWSDWSDPRSAPLETLEIEESLNSLNFPKVNQ